MLVSHAQAQDSEKHDDTKENGEDAGEESGEDEGEDSDEDDSLDETDELIEHSSEETADKDSTAELAKEFADVMSTHTVREPQGNSAGARPPLMNNIVEALKTKLTL